MSSPHRGHATQAPVAKRAAPYCPDTGSQSQQKHAMPSSGGVASHFFTAEESTMIVTVISTAAPLDAGARTLQPPIHRVPRTKSAQQTRPSPKCGMGLVEPLVPIAAPNDTRQWEFHLASTAQDTETSTSR